MAQSRYRFAHIRKRGANPMPPGPIGHIGPAHDPYVRLTHACFEELDGLTVPAGPPRRATTVPASAALDELRARLRHFQGEMVARRMMPSYFLGLTRTTLFGVGSILYAAGAPHPAWRRWFALRAVGARLLGDWSEAVTLGAVAGEWEFVDAIDGTEEKLDVAADTLWRILGKHPKHERVPSEDEGRWGEAWVALATAVAARDEPRVDRAMSALVDAALEEDSRVTADRYDLGASADSLVPWGWAAFCESGQACAAAAALKRLGLPPSDRIGVARLRYLEPGLAEGASWLGAQRFVPAQG
jgi:hypothetical protein